MVAPEPRTGDPFAHLPRVAMEATRTAVVRVLLTVLIPVATMAALSYSGAVLGGEEWARSASVNGARILQQTLTRVEADLARHVQALAAELPPMVNPPDALVVYGPAGPRVIGGSPRSKEAAEAFLAAEVGVPEAGCGFATGPTPEGPTLTLVCSQPATATRPAATLFCLPPADFLTTTRAQVGTELTISLGGEPVMSSWRSANGALLLPARDRPWTPKPGEPLEPRRVTQRIEGGYAGFGVDMYAGPVGDDEFVVFEASAPLLGSDGEVDAWFHAGIPSSIVLNRPTLGLVAACVVTVFLVLAQLPALRRRIASLLDPVTAASDRLHRMALALSQMSADVDGVESVGAPSPPLPPGTTREMAMLTAASARLESEVRRTQEVARWRDRMEERLRAATEEAQRSDRAKSEFVANMSHELRTPLTLIIGHTELLLEELAPGASEVRDDLAMVRRSGIQLLSIINDLLDIAKIEAGALDLRPEPFSFSSLLGSVVESFRPAAVDQDNELVLRLHEPLPPLLGDPVRVEQIVTNLIGNAVKFTHGGRIEVRVERLEGGVSFEVQDTGIGMTAEERDAVFGAFVQGDASATRRTGGTGLGLTITRELVVAMGGEIDVSSAPGRGSLFRVLLPLVDAAAEDSRGVPIDIPEAARGEHLAFRR